MACGAWCRPLTGEGRLLYYFGQRGSGLGDFQLPTGLQIDNSDRIYVVDSFNHRIEVFHYYAAARTADGGEAMKWILASACVVVLAQSLAIAQVPRRCDGHAQPVAAQRSFGLFPGKPRLHFLPRSA